MATDNLCLEQALAAVTDFSIAEILFARSSSPYHGLFEQLRTCYGQLRAETAMRTLARSFSFALASAEDLASFDVKNVLNPEIQRLMLKLRALPLEIKTFADKKFLYLATSDPFCSHTINCFAKFFSAEVKPVLAWETEIQKKLMYSAEGSGSYQTLSDSNSSMPVLNEHLQAFENLLTEALKFGASEIEFEFEKKRIIALLQSKTKKKSEILNLDSEEFVAFLLRNSRIKKITTEGFSAWGISRVFKQFFTFNISFYKSYLSVNTRKSNVLIINEFSLDPRVELSRFYFPFDHGFSGLVLLENEALIPLLKRAYPAAYFPSAAELSNNKNYAVLAGYFPVFSISVPENLPAPLSSQLFGILKSQKLKQNCGFCATFIEKSFYTPGCSLCNSDPFEFFWLEKDKHQTEESEELKLQVLTQDGVICAEIPANSQRLSESPLFFKPARSEKKGMFHSVVLKMDETLKSFREENTNKQASEKKPSSGYHSVVLDLDDDLTALREKLKKEDPKK